LSEKTKDEKNGKEDDYITVRIPKELSQEADKLIGKKGFKSKAEIVKEALRKLLDHYGADKNFQMLNRTSDGVKIRDLGLGQVADIKITPEGIYCPICDASNCEHIRFALDQPDIKNLIGRKKKEGWKLPDI
jgi:Arc/MetJ-type ribon-helix-helix transcriptional regulator